MKTIDANYLGLGALWLVLGMGLGIVMAATHDFQYAPVHAHINLIGFASHSIFGLAYRHWQAMKAARLAPFQFWIFVVSTPIMLVSLVFTLSGGPLVPTLIGASGVLVGAILFCIMIWQARTTS
jgi:hypothetical protein